MPSRPAAALRRHLAPVALAAVAGLLLAGAPAGPAAAAPASGGQAARPAAASQRLLVRGYEWRLVLSKLTVRRGTLLVQLRNLGEDPHDVVARKLDRWGRQGGARHPVGVAPSGATATGTWSLRRGHYRLVCTLPGHAASGMRASLRVR